MEIAVLPGPRALFPLFVAVLMLLAPGAVRAQDEDDEPRPGFTYSCRGNSVRLYGSVRPSHAEILGWVVDGRFVGGGANLTLPSAANRTFEIGFRARVSTHTHTHYGTVSCGTAPTTREGTGGPGLRGLYGGGTTFFGTDGTWLLTCDSLPASISVTSNTPGVQCQLVFGAGIGNAEVMKAGPLHAGVDIWGPTILRARVCFSGMGRTVFLDAATSPRALSPLTSWASEGRTCTMLDRAGTVVQLPGRPTHSAPPSGPATTRSTRTRPDSMSAGGPQVALTGCNVTTVRGSLRFRKTPGGVILRLLQAGTTLAADARTPNWFRVTHDGRSGWISADFVNTDGACGQA